MRLVFRWVSATAAFFLGGYGLGLGGLFLAGAVSWISWELNPGWQRTLPPPLLAIVSVAISVTVLYLTFQRWRRRRASDRPIRPGLVPLMCGFAFGLAGWFAAAMVELRIDRSAVGELQLLDEIEMPRGFVDYDRGFQGNDVGANVFYIGPPDALSREAIRLPEGYAPVPYPQSIQVYPKGWRPYAAWVGPNPFEPGRCELMVDVARSTISGYDIRQMPDDAEADVREGTKTALYVVAYCDYEGEPTARDVRTLQKTY